MKKVEAIQNNLNKAASPYGLMVTLMLKIVARYSSLVSTEAARIV